VFVSYSHKDNNLFREFKTMLAPAIAGGVVQLWDDTQIRPGAKWREEIANALASTRVAVLLVSSNFLASEFIAKNELPPLLKAAEQDGATVFWVYLSSCLYGQTEIANYQAAHDIAKPLDQLSKPKRQAILSELCARLIRLAENPHGGSSAHDPRPPVNSAAAWVPSEPQSNRRPSGPHDYIDGTVSRVATILDRTKPLTLPVLFRELNELFNRSTFRFEPLKECLTQEWGARLHAAVQTLEVLRLYSSFVSEHAPALHARTYEKLMDEVNGYCQMMAVHLFEQIVELSSLQKAVGTREFNLRLPKPRKFTGGVDADTDQQVDGRRVRAIKQMDKLRREYSGVEKPAAETIKGSGKADVALPQSGHCEIGPLTLSAKLKSPRGEVGDAYPTGSNGPHFRFDLFNPSQRDFVVHAVEVETMSYQPIDLDFLQHGVGATSVSRLYKAEIHPALKRYSAIYSAPKEPGEYVKIVSSETEVFDLEVTTNEEGLYTLCTRVVGSVAGNRVDITIEGTKRPIVFFAQGRNYPVDRGQGGEYISYSEYIEEMARYNEQVRAYAIHGAEGQPA
jgi:TIR domain